MHLFYSLKMENQIFTSCPSLFIRFYYVAQDSGALKRADVPIKDTAALAGHVLNMMSEKHSLRGIAQSLKGLTSSLSAR